jgi:phage gp36-like protein
MNAALSLTCVVFPGVDLVIQLCLAVFNQLRQAVLAVSLNKAACQALAERVHSLKDTLEERAQAISQALVDRVRNTMQRIEGSLSRYCCKSYAQQLCQQSKYIQKFSDFNTEVGDLVSDITQLTIPARTSKSGARSASQQQQPRGKCSSRNIQACLKLMLAAVVFGQGI